MGLQTVDRAVAVLQLLSASGPGGMRLVDVQVFRVHCCSPSSQAGSALCRV